MKIKTFIERPVLSIVISVAIILVGVIALFTLPIEQFPSIAPPTVEVTTSYPGANAETVQKSVIVPLEEAINGVENMTYINSTASNAGDVYITIYFKQGTDPDMAAVNVQNRVSKAQGQLPADYGLIGGSGPSSGMIIAQLTDWSERTDEGKSGIKAVLERINAIAADMPDVQIFAMAPPLIDGYGVANGFEIYLQDRAGGSVDELYNVGRKFIDELQKRPEIGSAYTTFNVNFPQFLVEVDAAKCQRARTTADAVLATLAGYYSGQYVSNFNRFNKLYRVMIQSSPEYRITPESLDKIYTRVGDGKMAPLSQFVTLTKVYGPESLGRFNLYSAMGINGEAAQGYSSGDAIKAIQEVAASSLPRGYGFEFSGLSREESQTTNNTAIIFIVCTVFVYLILCGLYESFFVPFAVILSVPFGLMGSFLFAKLMGLENNIYLQTGLIILIGLLSKTAILLTEYAADRRRAGMTLVQAALAAAKVHLRPILMTILAMIFGLLPLMFASGAGANGNSSLGSGVIGGMIFGILAILFFVPVFFVLFQFIQEKVRPVEFLPYPDWEIRSEMESIDKRKKDKK